MCEKKEKKMDFGIDSYYCQISPFAKSPVLISLCVSWLGISISIIYVIAGLCILKQNINQNL